MGNRFVTLVAVVGIAVLAAAGIYLYRHHSQPPSVEEKVTKAEAPAPAPQKPAEPKQAEPVPAQPVSVPSFDIVRIEPTGEGVMAGRAEPGWSISIESDGAAIAETKADGDGAWTVVLDKPLAPGDHSLALRATSPDGTQALTAQAPQQVAVTEKEPTAPRPPKEQAQAPAAQEQPKTAEAASETPKLEQKAEAPQGVEGQPEPVVPDENAPPPGRPKPPVRIGELDYQDTGANSGKISISGVGDPNIRLFLFFDEEPLGQVTIGPDGTWAIDIDKKLGEGEHTIRADTYDQKTGMVAGRASVRLGREPQPAPNEATASQSAAPAAPAAAGTGQLSGQPQPVYPEGAAEAEPASPEASTSAANTEPRSLSSQPQPVVPPEEATPEVANAEPAPAEPAPAEPVQAAPAAPQPAQAKPEAQVTAQPASPKPAVVFKSVDYKDIGADSGKVSLAGTGNPGAHIRLFLDETPVGEAIVADDGTWVFAAEKRLETGEHKFRADSTKGGAAVGSASIGLVRMEKPKARPKQEQAAAEPAPAPAPAAGAAPQASPELQVAGTEEAKPAASREKTVHHKHRPRVYTVRHGDTLWEIAEAYYGGGWHYRAIVRDNKRSIKNPHWIYPRQKFHIPRGK